MRSGLHRDTVAGAPEKQVDHGDEQDGGDNYRDAVGIDFNDIADREFAVEWRIQGAGIPAEDHAGQCPEDESESDGENKYTRLGLADDAPHDVRVEEIANHGDRRATQHECGPESPTQCLGKRQHSERPEHHEFAMREIHDFGRLINKNETHRNQAIGAALGNAGHSQMNDVIYR